MKRKILQFILKRLKNANYTHFKECYECAVKRGSPQLCEQCYWVRENYKPNRIIFMNQQEEMNKRFDKQFVEMHPMNGQDMYNPPLLYQAPFEDIESIKSFIQSEINLALANRNKEIMEMIENMPNATRDEVQNEKVICSDDIINLITKANKE